MMEDIIEVNPLSRPNSLMKNLSISNGLVDRIKVAKVEDKGLHKLLIYLELVQKIDDGVIRFNGRVYVPI